MAGKFACIVGLTISTFLPAVSSASGIVYQINTLLPDSPKSGSSIPSLTADFENANGGVLLTISGSGLTGGEFASDVYFNLDPAMNAANLVFNQSASTGAFSTPTIQQSSSQSFKADGNGKYNLEFNFGAANGTAFTSGNSITYLISGISGLTCNDFAFLPSGGNGSCYTEACVNSQGDDKNTWICAPVPEPSTVALFSFAFFLFAATKRLAGKSLGLSYEMAAQKRKICRVGKKP